MSACKNKVECKLDSGYGLGAIFGSVDPESFCMSRATVASVMNREIIEATYHQWRLDPSSVDPSWSYFFEGFEAGLAAMGDSASQPVAALVSKPSQPASEDGRDARDHLGISRLIHRYRDLGHLVADLNPLQPAPDKDSPLLAVEQFNLSNEDNAVCAVIIL